MKKLKNSDYKLLYTLMKLNQFQTHEYMKIFLKQYYNDMIITSNYIIARGDIPIALVAHMDTVDENTTKYEMLYDTRKNILASLYSMGFDDKAGIAAIIKLILDGLRPHVILTMGEEAGCVGSSELIHDLPKSPFADLRYMIQIDRRGTNDCVFYNDDNQTFINFVEDFGYYKEALGSYTDIAIIAPAWGISGVNLSTGYFNEHTRNEYLDVDAWYETINQVKLMLKVALESPVFNYVESLSYYSFYHHNNAPYGITDTCAHCKKEFDWSELVDVIFKDGSYGQMCEECAEKYTEYCPHCLINYEVDPDDPDAKCPYCGGVDYYDYRSNKAF